MFAAVSRCLIRGLCSCQYWNLTRLLSGSRCCPGCFKEILQLWFCRTWPQKLDLLTSTFQVLRLQKCTPSASKCLFIHHKACTINRTNAFPEFKEVGLLCRRRRDSFAGLSTQALCERGVNLAALQAHSPQPTLLTAAGCLLGFGSQKLPLQFVCSMP